MAKELIVNGTPFQYPTEGGQNWGEEATAWAEEVTGILGTIAPPGFISETTVDIADNVSSFTNVLGAIFDSSTNQSFRLTYAVRRSDGSVMVAETGTIQAVYSGTDWSYSIDLTGDAGMEFEVTSGGQVRYKSSAIGGTYTGVMKFFANVISAAV